MGNDSQKDELKVEQYDAETAEKKKKKILKRVGIGIGVAVVVGVLGYFGLTALQNDTSQNNANQNNTRQNSIRQNNVRENDIRQNNTSQNTDWRGPELVGGSGTWYASVVVPLEDSHG
ncbi:MAG: hypothetical protein FWC79_03815 [Oscillospiraceae bacterium]|nr:hypothetical protein [Oscillospiraceae bacterium]